ncbi:MAG: hypothetical protein JXR78_06530 [Victivallales bacterium]|nr:hypothetical protein [Victivallales bacterium]
MIRTKTLLTLSLCALLGSTAILAKDQKEDKKNKKEEKDVYLSFNKKIKDLGKTIMEIQKKKEEQFKKDEARIFKRIESVKKQIEKAGKNPKRVEALNKDLTELEESHRFMRRCAALPDLKLQEALSAETDTKE